MQEQVYQETKEKESARVIDTSGPLIIGDTLIGGHPSERKVLQVRGDGTRGTRLHLVCNLRRVA